MNNQVAVRVENDGQAMGNALKWVLEPFFRKGEAFGFADAPIRSGYPGCLPAYKKQCDPQSRKAGIVTPLTRLMPRDQGVMVSNGRTDKEIVGVLGVRAKRPEKREAGSLTERARMILQAGPGLAEHALGG